MADPDDEVLEGETLALDDESGDDVTENADGSAVVRLENENQSARATEHFANIVDDVDPSLLSSAVTDLLEKIGYDKQARQKRDEQYEEGLRRTGLGNDAPGGAKFSGANKVVHPMLIEACVDFSARAMKELFPAIGPVKSKILGSVDKEKSEKAQRKAAFMNWQTTEQMPEFRGELEQLTTQLPLGGGQYLKMNWRADRRRPGAEFVAIDDVLIPFAATNFYTAERKTHVQYITSSEYQKRVKSGMYRDVDLPMPEMPEMSKASTANDKIEGRSVNFYNEDGLRTVYEVQVWLDIEGEMSPYILSIDKSSQEALSLYRNWSEDDPMLEELDWIVEFPFIPWRGAYPIGLTHMIGSLSGAATGALRALLDSAHIQNVPTAVKLKGGASGQTIAVQATEIAELDGGAMVDDIRKLIMPLPFAGPSPTLFQLLGFLVDAGKGIVQTSFEKISDVSPNQPVGTTMALIEQGMVVFSSIHARLHASMGRVFKILHRINSSYLTDEDIAAQGSGLDVRPQDFDDPMDVVPVSDPSIFSETQRFAQVTAIQQRAAAMPQLYDARKVEEMFLKAMRVNTDVLVPVAGEDNRDPVSENVAASMGQPIYVLPKQDHLAHLKVHLAFASSPLFGKNPVIAKAFALPMVQHLKDHLLNYYLTESQLAVSDAQRIQMIDGEDAQQQAQVIEMIQQQIERDFAGFAETLTQEDANAQQYVQQPPMPPDSALQVAQITAQTRAQSEQIRAEVEREKAARQAQLDQRKLDQQKEKDQATLQLEAQALQSTSQQKAQDLQAKFVLQQIADRADADRQAASDETRERINTADNQTALQIVAAEMATGEQVSISTGSGINP